MSKSHEEWMVLPSNTDYAVSSLGRIKSLKRQLISIDGVIRNWEERILSASLSRNYKTVSLAKNKKRYTVRVHQLVMESFKGFIYDKTKNLVIDHIDNDPHNNKLSNLQVITQRMNTSKNNKGKSKYTGVSFHKKSNKWISNIHIKGKLVYLGLFSTEEEASLAYNTKLTTLKN